MAILHSFDLNVKKKKNAKISHWNLLDINARTLCPFQQLQSPYDNAERKTSLFQVFTVRD